MLLPVEYTSFCLLGEILISLMSNFYFIYTISVIFFRYIIISASVFPFVTLQFGTSSPPLMVHSHFAVKDQINSLLTFLFYYSPQECFLFIGTMILGRWLFCLAHFYTCHVLFSSFLHHLIYESLHFTVSCLTTMVFISFLILSCYVYQVLYWISIFDIEWSFIYL